MQYTFQRHLTVCNVPCYDTVKVCITEFFATGHEITGAPLITRIPENMVQICVTIIWIPKHLVQYYVALLILSETAVHWINFYPYKMAIVQELSASDKQNHLQFCRCFF
jgi:hypothetical protein